MQTISYHVLPTKIPSLENHFPIKIRAKSAIKAAYGHAKDQSFLATGPTPMNPTFSKPKGGKHLQVNQLPQITGNNSFSATQLPEMAVSHSFPEAGAKELPGKLLTPDIGGPSQTTLSKQVQKDLSCKHPTTHIKPRKQRSSSPKIQSFPAKEELHPMNSSEEAMTAFWDYQFLFISQRSETEEPVALRLVHGQVPCDFPKGTYYLAGPGLFIDDMGSTVHPLDGHGYLRAFSIVPSAGKNPGISGYAHTNSGQNIAVLSTNSCLNGEVSGKVGHFHGESGKLSSKVGGSSGKVDDFSCELDQFSSKLAETSGHAGPFSSNLGQFSGDVDAFSGKVGHFSNKVGAFSDETDRNSGHSAMFASEFDHLSTETAQFSGRFSGEVKLSARYVATQAKQEEYDEKSKKWIFGYRGPFSVLKFGQKFFNTKVMKNVANTSVLKWGGRLLCLWEGGDPHEIEPESLNTVRVGDFISRREIDVGPPESSVDGRKRDMGSVVLDFVTGLLRPVLYGVYKMPPKRLLSHYKIDARRNRLLMMSCNAEDMLLPRSSFTVYEFDSKFNLLQEKGFEILDHVMIHDWAFTEDHYILVANRVKIDVAGSISALCGISPMISALSLDPSHQSSRIYVIPRFSEGTRDWRLPIEAPSLFWLLHAGNAFERRDEHGNLHIQLQASACSYQWFNFHKMFGYDWRRPQLDPTFMNKENAENLPHLVQVSMELGKDRNFHNCTVEPLSQWMYTSDFLAINPAFSGTKNKYLYTSSCSGSRPSLPYFPFDMVAKLNMTQGSVATWCAGFRRFVGEPVFVPRGEEEDDGYILVVEYAVSVQRCYLVMLDAKEIGKPGALVAKFEVPKELNFPVGFHGFWVNDESG
ncbi:hypothetical protein AMTRI_Chr13g83450 [Amborella trichopoda]